jgi:NADPH:quinone reductase-like Zn-dependent oxidoreductase
VSRRALRAGQAKEWLQHRLPLIPGWDVCGVVEAMGKGVTAFKEGDGVYGKLNFKQNGAYAEYVVASAQALAPPP